jgi:hypothetical protein
MKILLVSKKEFKKELGIIRHNLKNHKGIFQTTDIGKVPTGINKENIILDKDIKLIEEIDGILICNFEKTKFDKYFIIIMSIAYYLNKKIYLLYDLSNKYIDKLNCFQATSLNGDLKKIM